MPSHVVVSLTSSELEQQVNIVSAIILKVTLEPIQCREVESFKYELPSSGRKEPLIMDASSILISLYT